MAIIANRVRIVSNSTLYFKIIAFFFKRSLNFLLILISAYFLYFSIPKKFSSLIFEFSGNLISNSLFIYKIIETQIDSINSKLIYFKELEIENAKLKLEVKRFEKLNAKFQEMQIENIRLNKILNVTLIENSEKTTAKILSIHLTPYSKTALIQGGLNHGINVDQIVTNDEGLIGRVIEVSNNYSKIMLINDVNSRIPVVTSVSQERGILVGDNDRMKIIYVNENHHIENSEKILTSGDGKVYPPSIEIGEVVSINGEVLVKPLVNFNKIDYVTIHKVN